jgi:hypothetical protein
MLYVAALLELLEQMPWRGLAGGAEMVCHLAQAWHVAVFHVKRPQECQQLFLPIGEGSWLTHGSTRSNHQARIIGAARRASKQQITQSLVSMFIILGISLLAGDTMWSETCRAKPTALSPSGSCRDPQCEGDPAY